jgi:GT2 family glycosyltransferase
MSLRRRPTAGRAWAEAILGGALARRIATWSVLIADPANYHAGTRADWATGAATMVGRECLDKVGGFDESFFLYSEETEFELRAADHGFRLAFAPDATVIHLGGASKVRPELWALTCANAVRLHSMRSRRPAAWSFWAAVLIGELLRVSVSRPATRRAAIGKLIRERSALTSGRPAKHPYPGD